MSAAGRVRAVLKGRWQEPLIGHCLPGGGAEEPQERGRDAVAVLLWGGGCSRSPAVFLTKGPPPT